MGERELACVRACVRGDPRRHLHARVHPCAWGCLSRAHACALSGGVFAARARDGCSPRRAGVRAPGQPWGERPCRGAAVGCRAALPREPRSRGTAGLGLPLSFACGGAAAVRPCKVTRSHSRCGRVGTPPAMKALLPPTRQLRSSSMPALAAHGTHIRARTPAGRIRPSECSTLGPTAKRGWELCELLQGRAGPDPARWLKIRGLT